MALRGRRSLHGRPLPSAEEAAQELREVTGQDFGLDADKWADWLRTHRRELNAPRAPDITE
jgi:hypothetical protein